jgi:hypothetical protein
MDIGTLITILIFVGGFIYSALQNAKSFREQQPGQSGEPDTAEQDLPWETDPFEEEAQRKRDLPETQTSSEIPETDYQQQEPEPVKPQGSEGPYPRELLQRETTRSTNTETSEHKPYSRSEEQAYGRQEATPYERASKQAYQRKQKQAYRRKKAAMKQRKKAQKALRKKQLRSFDPVEAVMYSEILNRPKYLEDPHSGTRW